MCSSSGTPISAAPWITSSRDVRRRFDALVTELSDRPGVAPPTGSRAFGGSGMKVDGSVFAMVDVWERFVVKLPAERVAALVAEGAGRPFDNGKGRVMRQWLVVDDAARERELTEEALAFVGGRASGASTTGRPTSRRPPATCVRRALEAEAGITRLEQLTGWSERELLAIHGVGPQGRAHPEGGTRRAWAGAEVSLTVRDLSAPLP